MARGRIISNEIARDKKINNLSDDTSRLAFTWLVTFADAEGRTPGDAAIVRSMVFPRRDDITIERMEKYIQEWHDAGLIVWYEAQDDLWIAFPNFDKHQPNLRKEREGKSTIPAPPLRTTSGPAEITPAQVRSNSGVSPEQIRVKLSKENIREESPAADAAGDTPSEPSEKPKSELTLKLERLERVFADARGCPPPEWTASRAKSLQKTWRTPIRAILSQCGGDTDRAETVIRAVVGQMIRDKLTFSQPVQILKTAESFSIDLRSPGGNNGYTAA
jgi:hypothetical protein